MRKEQFLVKRDTPIQKAAVVVFVLGGIILALLSFLRPRMFERTGDKRLSVEKQIATNSSVTSSKGIVDWRERWRSGPKTSAEEIVTSKVTQFARSRRKLAEALAEKHKVTIPPEVERFFQAVERGNWDEIEATFTAISGEDSSAGPAPKRSPEINKLWPAIIDAFGAAEQAHLLPAKVLLDYGSAILDSLKPGMIYVGGTDPGRWVPALLNENGEGGQNIVITQNGLADSTYLDYVNLQFGNQINTLTEADNKHAFEEYVADARKRLEHDQQFPNEPKQLRPGEEVKIADGNVQVSGQIAVMSINEKLLQRLMALNPDSSFGLQESFPLRETYPDSVPLGPIMELGAGNDGESFTADAATESLNYWRQITQQILGDAESSSSTETLKTYSHDTVSAGNLLAAHNFTAEAEEAYRIASNVWPGNPESPLALATLLAQTGRVEEGNRIVEEFLQKFPGERVAIERGWGAAEHYGKK